MTKEDKQIIDRATKEHWRIGDRTRLKRLLEKNLKLYCENEELTRDRDYYSDALDKQVEATLKLYKEYAELEKENAELKEKYNKVDIIGYDALKNLTRAEDIIRALLFHLTNDTFYVTFETREQSVERAIQFLQRRAK